MVLQHGSLMRSELGNNRTCAYTVPTQTNLLKLSPRGSHCVTREHKSPYARGSLHYVIDVRMKWANLQHLTNRFTKASLLIDSICALDLHIFFFGRVYRSPSTTFHNHTLLSYFLTYLVTLISNLRALRLNLYCGKII